MGVLNYTTAQINNLLRKQNAPYMLSVGKIADTADTVVISAGQINTFVPIQLNLNTLQNNGFTVSASGITYTGVASKFTFDGVCTIGSSVTNTTVNLRLAKNGSIIAETDSAGRVDAVTSFTNLNANAVIDLNPNDVLTIHVKSDKACTISAYHPQLRLIEL